MATLRDNCSVSQSQTRVILETDFQVSNWAHEVALESDLADGDSSLRSIFLDASLFKHVRFVLIKNLFDRAIPCLYQLNSDGGFILRNYVDGAGSIKIFFGGLVFRDPICFDQKNVFETGNFADGAGSRF